MVLGGIKFNLFKLLEPVEYQDVNGFAVTTLHDWLKRLAPIFHPDQN